jgi:hypothetical protein
MTIARYYDEEKNKDGAFFPGVPLRDLTADEWDAFPGRMQASVDASPFYRKTPPPRETAPLKAPAKE